MELSLRRDSLFHLIIPRDFNRFNRYFSSCKRRTYRGLSLFSSDLNTSCIQPEYSLTLTKTSGNPGFAHPDPNDVIPAKYHRPSLRLHCKGPPLSPTQVPV